MSARKYGIAEGTCAPSPGPENGALSVEASASGCCDAGTSCRYGICVRSAAFCPEGLMPTGLNDSCEAPGCGRSLSPSGPAGGCEISGTEMFGVGTYDGIVVGGTLGG